MQYSNLLSDRPLPTLAAQQQVGASSLESSWQDLQSKAAQQGLTPRSAHFQPDRGHAAGSSSASPSPSKGPAAAALSQLPAADSITASPRLLNLRSLRSASGPASTPSHSQATIQYPQQVPQQNGHVMHRGSPPSSFPGPKLADNPVEPAPHEQQNGHATHGIAVPGSHSNFPMPGRMDTARYHQGEKQSNSFADAETSSASPSHLNADRGLLSSRLQAGPGSDHSTAHHPSHLDRSSKRGDPHVHQQNTFSPLGTHHRAAAAVPIDWHHHHHHHDQADEHDAEQARLLAAPPSGQFRADPPPADAQVGHLRCMRAE